MGDKKNTILLTVIAVATLLVAVVGASFAFFAVQETTTANVSVKAETADAADVFSATGSGSMTLNVTNDLMMEDDGNDDAAPADLTKTDSNMKISLLAGSGVATCTYQLAYASTGDTYEKTAGADKEYTLAGSDGTQSFDETNMDAIATTLAGKTYTITNAAADGEATVQTWTFTTKFYNLEINQGKTETSNGLHDKSFAGNVTVTNVNCENNAK